MRLARQTEEAQCLDWVMTGSDSKVRNTSACYASAVVAQGVPQGQPSAITGTPVSLDRRKKG